MRWILILIPALLLGCRDTPSIVSEHSPGVAAVSGSGSIIHILDWHYVPKDLLAKDLGLSGPEMEKAYQQHLADVDRVQQSQMAIIRHLHEQGVRQFFLEGLTEETLAEYHVRVTSAKEVAALQQKIADMQKQLGRQEKDDLAAEAKEELLRLGAVGRLMVEGLDLAPQPLDDARLLEEAKPSFQGGFDPKKVKAREDAILHKLKGGQVIILGGNHEMKGCVRVMPKGYPEE